MTAGETVKPATADPIDELLTRNVAQVEVRGNLERKLRSGKQLRVKMGFDPSAPDIHLGHAVGMRKLRAFQDLGHKVVLIVGDWTAQIGDPTGRSTQRRLLSRDEVHANAQTYMEQFFRIVDPDPDKVEVRWQTTWYETFSLADVLRLTSQFTVAQMLAREDFNNRYTSGSPIAILELLYPLLQAYDSVAVQADVEMGGTDQTFNLLVGRDIQEKMGQSPQDILTVPILVGTDGVQKMSKSLGNYVGVTDPPNDMYGKLMSIPDSALPDYLTLTTTYSDQEIESFKAQLESGVVNPRDIKDKMARNVIEQFYSPADATAAAEEFARVHRAGEAPSDMPEVEVDYPSTAVALLRAAGFASSNNEARRLVDQGGVRIDGERVTSADEELSFTEPIVLQAGRRRFARLLPGRQG